MEADSKIIQDTGVRYLSDLNKTYYTIESIEDTESTKKRIYNCKGRRFSNI